MVSNLPGGTGLRGSPDRGVRCERHQMGAAHVPSLGRAAGQNWWDPG